MKRKQFFDSFKLGLFLIMGAVLLTILIFSIGSNDKILQKKTRISALFKNVSGLKKGSDVRLSGVEVGVIDKIEIINDTSIKVIMIIETKSARFIKKDSYATIKTEGLVGGSYIGITPGKESTSPIAEGDRIATKEALSLETMVSMINETGNNARDLTDKLNTIALKIENGDGTIGALLSDKGLKENVLGMIADFRSTSANTENLTQGLINVPSRLDHVSQKLVGIADSFQVVGGHTIGATKRLNEFAENLNDKENTVGKMVGDSIFAYKVEATLQNVDSTARDLQATSSRLRESFFVRFLNKNKKTEKAN